MKTSTILIIGGGAAVLGALYLLSRPVSTTSPSGQTNQPANSLPESSSNNTITTSSSSVQSQGSVSQPTSFVSGTTTASQAEAMGDVVSAFPPNYTQTLGNGATQTLNTTGFLGTTSNGMYVYAPSSVSTSANIPSSSTTSSTTSIAASVNTVSAPITDFTGTISGTLGSASNPYPMANGWEGAGYYYFPAWQGMPTTYLSSPQEAQAFAEKVTGTYSNIILTQTGVQ
jgi:hypothetical protein